MHYLIETIGPLSQQTITRAVMAYMNYPSYMPPGKPRQVARRGPPSPLPGIWPVQGAVSPRPLPDFLAATSATQLALQGVTGTPMVLQMGNTIEVAPGIRLRQLSNLGRTYQDLFFWSATGRTHVLGVSGRGAHHEWTTLPPGWDNQAFANAPAAELGRFTPGQTLPAAITHLTTAQKVGEAMYRSVKYVGEEAKPILLQLISPQAIGYVIAIEALYAVSLFFGVGEVVTLVLVVAGVYFVGQVVVEVVESLVAFVQRATAAKSEADLEAAAKHFAHAMTLGVDIVVGLLSRKLNRPGRPTVLRAKAQGGGGKRPTVQATTPVGTSKQGKSTKPPQGSGKSKKGNEKPKPDGSEENPYPTSREARREAMRKEGIPTSQQPKSQKKTPAGRTYEYETPTPGGGKTKKQAQDQTKDQGHGPHWEVGETKKGGQKDGIGRDRLNSGKSKKHYEERKTRISGKKK